MGPITRTSIPSFARSKRIGHGHDIFSEIAGGKLEIAEKRVQESHCLGTRSGRWGKSVLAKGWRLAKVFWEQIGEQHYSQGWLRTPFQNLKRNPLGLKTFGRCPS
jgi:hypothetical protein